VKDNVKAAAMDEGDEVARGKAMNFWGNRGWRHQLYIAVKDVYEQIVYA